MSRLDDLKRFYELLGVLAKRLGGTRTLREVVQYRDWPERGVYFFFEPGEVRTDTGDGPRVVRVGTHALTAGAKSSLLGRLKQHRGTEAGSGDHRGSAFRLLVGDALIGTGRAPQCVSWGIKGDSRKAAAKLGLDRQAMRGSELPIESMVSSHLGQLSLLWLDVPDDPGPNSLRAQVETNSIALLSNFRREPIDPPSGTWLGKQSRHERVAASGLWNRDDVEKLHDQSFLNTLAELIG